LIAEAKTKASKDEAVTKRLQAISMWLMYAKISLAESLWERKDDKIYRDINPDFEKLLKNYVAILDSFKIDQINEGGSVKDFVKYMESVKAVEGKVITIKNAKIMLEIMPDFGGRLHQIYLKDKGNMGIYNQLKPGATDYPRGGGAVDAVQLENETFGFMERYRVVSSDEKSVVLETQNKGCKITKTYSIDPEKPIVNFKFEIISGNPDPITLSFLANAGLRIGNFNDTMTLLHGDPESDVWTGYTIANFGNRPITQDSWIYWNPKEKLGFIDKIDARRVKGMTIEWMPDLQRALYILAYVPVTLKEGETSSYEYSYEIITELPKNVKVEMAKPAKDKP
jgi:hypothetical protein